MLLHRSAHRSRIEASILAVLLAWTGSLHAADRTTLLIPMAHDAVAADHPLGPLPDQAFGDGAGKGWQGYIKLWQAHRADPRDESIRRFLGLPLKQAFELKAKRGRSAPRSLGWRAGSYAQVDTPHFVIYSRAAEAPSKRVAEDLERCYWVWTQMFFPLWEASSQVTAALAEMPADMSVQEYLRDQTSRITIRRKLRVVLFRNAEEYVRTLAGDNPGIERSTGFYHNGQQTIYLFAAEDDDAATRRHELVHQLFREATRSALGRGMPGEQTGFWLIEGIAGYFESLQLESDRATVGGWDASRLQFARYRVLVTGDVMAIEELIQDGRADAQQRQDIARWYAHAILQTHHLMDGGETGRRQWVYGQLAERYKIRAELPKNSTGDALAKLDASTRRFLQIDDQHLAANPPRHPPGEIVLAECPLSDDALRKIPPSPTLRWLDLTRIPAVNTTVLYLAPNPGAIEQLRLEATKVDAGLGPWLQKADNVTELDLSWTPMDDSTIRAISNAANLSVLYMTGSKVTDKSIDVIAGMRRLESVDLQRTGVTPQGIARLRAARPKLDINPLQLRPLR